MPNHPYEMEEHYILNCALATATLIARCPATRLGFVNHSLIRRIGYDMIHRRETAHDLQAIAEVELSATDLDHAPIAPC